MVVSQYKGNEKKKKEKFFTFEKLCVTRIIFWSLGQVTFAKCSILFLKIYIQAYKHKKNHP